MAITRPLLPITRLCAVSSLLFFALSFFSCTNGVSSFSNGKSGEDSTTMNETTSHEALLAEDSRIERDPNFLKQQFPVLGSIVKSESPIYVPLNNYAYDIQHEDKSIQSENDLKRLFYKRDAQIMPTLHGDIFDPLAMKNPDFFVGETGRKLQAELQKIGIQCIYAEGMYVDLGASEMLSSTLKKYGSEVFRLYVQFLNAHGEAVGGEYPYMDLSGEIRMVAIAENMLDKYTDHEYTKTIRSDFEFALHALTDIHLVFAGYDATQLCGALNTDPYPYMTNFEEHKKFVADYPQTKYGQIVQKVLQNTSEIVHAENGFKDLYLVVLQWHDSNTDGDGIYCDDAEALKDSLYLHKGIDVPHVLPLIQDGISQCALTYRFYSDRPKAERALKTIQSQVKEPINIVKASFNAENQVWEVVK